MKQAGSGEGPVLKDAVQGAPALEDDLGDTQACARRCVCCRFERAPRSPHPYCRSPSHREISRWVHVCCSPIYFFGGLRGPGTCRRRRRAAPTAAAASDGDGAQTDVPECPCPADSPTAPAADGAGRRARRGRGRRGRRSPTAAAAPLDASSDSAALDETRTAATASAPGAQARATRSSWESLDAVVLRDVFAAPLPTMRDVPRFLAAGVRRAFVHALRGLHSPNPAAGITAERAWKLFLLVPRLLLTRTRETGPAGRTALLQRFQAFEAGRWCELLDAAMPSTAQPQRSPGSDVERMREHACAQVRRGELSRARQTLTGAPLAPSNADALRLLSDPDKRPPHPRHPIPDDVVRFRAANPLRLKAAELGEALRTAKRGSAAGLSGASVEDYRLLLGDEEALDLLVHAASLFANADAPADVLRALALSRLTALSKPGKGVRGIATGDTLRRLVSRTLARRYAETFDRATRPFQFALQARAGTDCLAAMLRAASELDADATIVSLDGRSTYDTVSRAAFLTKLREVAPDLVPFVRDWYSGTSTPLVGLGWPMPRNLARRRL